MTSSGYLVGDIAGTELTADEADLLVHPALAGIILFKRNYISPQQIQSLCSAIKDVNTQLFISIDQEGGRVQRLQGEFTRLPPMHVFSDLYQQDKHAATMLAAKMGELMALEVMSVGIDFSYAPVLDLFNEQSSVIGDRAFAASATEVTLLAGHWIEGMRKAGMVSVGKHYPGHGSVVEDSHFELPVDKRSFDIIEQNDLSVFTRLADELDAVMPAHVLYPLFDDLPAGFSPAWLNWYRKNGPFNGAIFSDDLSMGGAAKFGDYQKRAALGLAAGCNFLLVCNAKDALRKLLNADDTGDFIEYKRKGHKAFLAKALKSTACRGKGLSWLQQTTQWQVLRSDLALLLGS